MEAEGIPEAAIDTFRHYYEQLESGETGMLPEDSIEPVDEVTELADLPEEDGPLDRAVVLKLNGGLGTSMGMTQAKSLIEAKDGLAFLDVVARQVQALRERAGAPVPLVLMNSFYTRDDSLGGAGRAPRAGAAACRRLRPAQGAEAARRRPDAGRVARRPRPGVVPARPRRPLHRAADLGHARRAARRRLPLGVHLQLRQPRRRARAARARLDRARGDPVRDGGHRPHGGRPQGRPHRQAARGRLPAARDRADAGGGPRRAAGHLAPPLREHEQPVGRPAGAARRCWRSARACSGCR